MISSGVVATCSVGQVRQMPPPLDFESSCIPPIVPFSPENTDFKLLQYVFQVYDVTPYVKAHPGGDAILRNVGGDATDGFHGQLAHGVVRTFIKNSLEKFYVGTLLPQKRKWEETEKKEEECVS